MVVGAALAGWSAGVVWGVAMAAGAYTGALADAGDGIDGWSPAVAAALIGAAEVGAWAADLRVPARLSAGVVLARVRTIAALAAGAGAAGAAILGPAAGRPPGGLALTAAGVAAAVAVAGAIRLLARRI